MEKKKYYPDVDQNLDFSKMEEGILEFWNKNKIFEESINIRKNGEEFVFYDGPPFASGLPHYGHMLAGYIKDTFARYQTMKGKRVERIFGWDCHGLPAEMGVEKESGISGRKAIEEYGIDKFNDLCKKSVMKYVNEWKHYVNRSGRWVDFDNGYKTMNLKYMESVIWVFKQLYDKGLLYEDFRVMPYSWTCQTPVSNAETKQDNSYREKADKAITVKFKFTENSIKEFKEKLNNETLNNSTLPLYFLAWTTTPWTLPSNLALAVNKDVDYVLVSKSTIKNDDNKIKNLIQDKNILFLSDRLYFKAIDPNSNEDIEMLVKMHNDSEIMKFVGFPDGVHTNFNKEKQKRLSESGTLEELIFCYDKNTNNCIGYCKIGEPKIYISDLLYDEKFNKLKSNKINDKVICIDYKLKREYWKNGYGTEIVYNLIKYIYNVLKLDYQIQTNPNILNIASIKICEKCGFKKTGVFEKFNDTDNKEQKFEILRLNKANFNEIDSKSSLLNKDENKLIEYFIIGKEALGKYKKELAIDEAGNFNILAEFKGEVLLGLHYEPILPFIKDLPEVQESKNSFSVLHGDYVTTTDGTGIVHTAPGFGEDDNIVCKKYGIPTVCPVDDAGCFVAPINDYIGKQVFETNDPIIIRLKEENKWLKTEQYLHNYPHCWRTDAPLIYRALSSWYVNVEKIKDLMIKNNQEINWIPEHIKNGRFGKWLEGARDWSISRNRFFGCPIPVWKSDNPDYPRIEVYGSIKELEEAFGVEVKDLHRPFIDQLTRPNPDDPTGKSKMVRVKDVMDCWFESGSMPYAQHHYPFENKEWFEKHFPADFITEGDGQLRGWFYVLLILSTALFDKPAFKNCISYGVAVDETGKKLSKRLRNYVDPLEVCNTFGSDALRWFMMKSPVLKGEELRIDKDAKDIKETLRMSIKPVINSYNFFCMYANSDGIKAKKINSSSNMMDKYILSKLKVAVENIKKAMDSYTPSIACKESEDFFEVLNNWYIRRNKNRFWKAEHDEDKIQAYDTLYTVLTTMSEAIAPLMPFTTEYIWRGLNNS